MGVVINVVFVFLFALMSKEYVILEIQLLTNADLVALRLATHVNSSVTFHHSLVLIILSMIAI